MRIYIDLPGVLSRTRSCRSDHPISRRSSTTSSLSLNSSALIPKDEFAKAALWLRELFQVHAIHNSLQNIACSWL